MVNSRDSAIRSSFVYKMNSTYTQFVASKRMGICDPIHELGMWGEFKGNGYSTASATMILEVEKSLDCQMPVIEKTFNQTEEASHGIVRPYNKYEEAASKPPEKVLRRLAQNREAARKSRLRKKAYVQQLESSKLKLIQLEQELDRARLLGVNANGGLDASQLVYSGTANSGITAFEKEYREWVEEQNRQTDKLRNALHSQVGEMELSVIVESCKSHYVNLFELKETAAKADVFYIMSGIWKTPTERLFLWIGGLRPSEILKVVSQHLELLTDDQLQNVQNLQQSCQQAEDALSQGLLRLQQILADNVATGLLGEGNYHLQQMRPAMENLDSLVRQIIFAK
ncbi:PREDICTED: TGACG-sequence-specific DNA-binding protein TGA-1A-like isoform X3 [Ipomoea nil]|uniref:TGACG-sequence-specific DNA-binding protein TGA-1A-like isoform X3 n=1 Tax=Ipomoea nil TaxID=35883 RepID=UPI000901731C|nr:PREDICTED: TGACG-sequence-specific DNA-binding protein TGA-1A-like isoform X3 [Ipomoea nil]